ncbi:hypothetical protein AcV7_002376 [Taiwanofungus camphoratus]|nr:hypothetical protein AcV7_002376 [Antrodia cinnamomea]
MTSFEDLAAQRPLIYGCVSGRAFVQDDVLTPSPYLQVPIVVVVVCLIVGIIIIGQGRGMRSRLSSMHDKFRTWARGAARIPGHANRSSGAQTRELTAEQLAGTTANGRGAANRGANRRASVRSTMSLPLYMKEPGDQEVVIFRGSPEMAEDAIRLTVILPPVDEGSDERTPANSLDLSRTRSISSIHVPMQDTPLLEGQETPERPQGAVLTTRPSLDTVGGSSEERSALMPNEESGERGPAPPYTETVSRDSGIGLNDSMDDTPAETSGVAPSDSGHTRRNSSRLSSVFTHPDSTVEHTDQNGNRGSRFSIFSLFNARQNAGTTSSVPSRPSLDRSRHSRGDSVPSMLSVSPSSSGHGHGHQRTHRPSHSGGSGLSMFRTRSNTPGGVPLNSPSTISLHSISSPLTHTLLRTEFTYPRTGPTPEQMKLIASVESFARFGVPYGPDAVAYASSSRVDLQPPPVFEDVVGSSNAPSSASERAESSALESQDTLSASPELQEAPSSSPDPQQSSSNPDPEETSSSLVPEPVSNAPSPALANEPETIPATAERAHESRPTAANSTESPPGPLSADHTQNAQKVTKVSAPPSSFRLASPLPSVRPGSQASSHASFATAEESFHSGSPQTTPAKPFIVVDAADELLSAPTTPRNTTRHLHEDTDMTLTSLPLPAAVPLVEPVGEAL